MKLMARAARSDRSDRVARREPGRDPAGITLVAAITLFGSSW
ncbi:hypothetical protein ACPPVO_53555 [Dactylosporangium sp. McL0621]